MVPDRKYNKSDLDGLLLNLEISIHSLSQIDANNNYNNLLVVNPIENPEITNSYSKKFFAGIVDSFYI